MSKQRTWWGDAFMQSLTNFINEGRLQRGRAYRTDRRVLSFDINQNKITATVRGNKNPYFGIHKEPKYKISIEFNTYSSNKWSEIINNICANPGWLSKLMLNEIPSDIDKAFNNKESLLPRKYSDTNAKCNCPDWENPCKHIAGIYYKLANILDSQPMLLFAMHGLPLDQLQQELKKSELGQAFAEQLSTIDNVELEIKDTLFTPIVKKSNIAKTITQKSYWCMTKWQITRNEHNEHVSAPIIKKQGDYPSFWDRQNSFVEAMEEVYATIKRQNRKIF